MSILLRLGPRFGEGLSLTARKRLASVCDDPAILAGLDRLRDSGELDDAFMRAVVERNISRDWLFLGVGEAEGKASGLRFVERISKLSADQLAELERRLRAEGLWPDND